MTALLKTLIVDDEQLARERLKSLVKELNAGEIIAEAGNGKQAIEAIQQQHPDIVLMDIRMPGMDGIEAAKHIAAMEDPPAVIFTTAFGDYALDAFDAHAVDYLLKPIRRERLEEAIKRARKMTQSIIESLQDELPRTRTHLSVFVQGNIQLIPVDEILFFHADQKYVSVFTRNQEVLIEESLKSLEKEFSKNFLRIHRSTLVAKNKIDTLEKNSEGKYQIRLKGLDEALPVSRRMISPVKAALRKL